MKWAAILGLVSAVSYGITDYLARSAGQAAGIWRSLFYGELLVFVVLSAWLFIAVPTIDISWHGHALAWVATVVSGIILLASAAALTRAFMVGSIAVVAPLAASYGAISALLSAATGEHLGTRVLCGIVVTLAGVALVSIPPNALRSSTQGDHSSGVGWALAGATGYGTGFWLQGAYSVPMLGPIVPVWLSYGIAIVLIAIFYQPVRATLAVPTGAALVPVLAVGAFSAGGYLALTAGLATGSLAVVVVLSSLSSGVTVLLSRFINHAPVARHQWIAIAVLIGGTILLRS